MHRFQISKKENKFRQRQATTQPIKLSSFISKFKSLLSTSLNKVATSTHTITENTKALKEKAQQSVTQATTTTATTKQENNSAMRPTLMKKLAYQPMIKFVGGPHTFDSASTAAKTHVCAPNGLLPNSAECIGVAELMKSWKPLIIKPYQGKSSSTSKTSSSGGSNSKTATKYEYTKRPLQKGEVASILDLPQQYRFKPIDEQEMDIIMGGGAPA